MRDRGLKHPWVLGNDTVIVSHARKFIFIKTLKTAGTSMEMALSKYCSEGDVLTGLVPDEEEMRQEVAGIGAQNHTWPLEDYALPKRVKLMLRGHRDNKFGEHTPAWLARQRLGEEIWNSYFKFAVARNPFDRAVSRYFYTKRYFEERNLANFWDKDSFDQFLRYHPEQINENWRMYTYRDEIIVDEVVRYEHLESDLASVSARIGLDHNLFEDLREIRAKSDYRPAGATSRTVLDPDHVDLIALLCSKEIERFGYDAGVEAPAVAAGAS